MNQKGGEKDLHGKNNKGDNDNHDEEDEEEEEDQDYDPREDEDNKESDIIIDKQQLLQVDSNHKVPILSQSKQRAVDEAFEDLFPNYNKAASSSSSSSSAHNVVENVLPSLKRSRNSYEKQKKILSDIFGGSKHVVAQLLLLHQTSVSRNNNNNNNNTKSPTKIGANNNNNDNEMNLSKGKKQKIQHDKESYYGEEKGYTFPTLNITTHSKDGIITSIQQTTRAESSTAAATTTTTSKTSGIDTILSKLDAPDKVTTLTKTSMDWEQFKDEQGLEDELAKKAQSKDAFLLKQEFLQRVDLRRFEHEKIERDKKRAAAAATGTTTTMNH